MGTQGLSYVDGEYNSYPFGNLEGAKTALSLFSFALVTMMASAWDLIISTEDFLQLICPVIW